MLPTDNLRKRFTPPAGGHMLWLLAVFAFTLVSVSCRQKEAPVNSSGYSDAFNAIYHNSRLYDVRKPAQGMDYLDSAFKQLSNPTINDKFRFYAIHFQYQKKATHDAEKELLYADSMLNVAAKCAGEKLYINFFSEANFAKGDAYFDMRQYNEAYRYFYQGYFLGKNHLNGEILAEYTYRMGMIAFNQSHFMIAAGYFKDSFSQSFVELDNFGSFYQRQELLNDIGESYMRNGNIDSAMLYFNKTLTYINKNSNRFKSNTNLLDIARAVTFGDQGIILQKMGRYNEAADLLKKSITINLKKFNDNYNGELAEINLAQLYLDQKKEADFIGTMNDLRNHLDSVKNAEAETEWNRLMSDYYVQKKNFKKSLTYFKHSTSLKDSLNKLSGPLRETDINQQLSNYEKQYQIQNLKDNNKLQRIYLYLAVIGVIMAVVIIFLVYRNWERSKRDILAISELNKQINLQKTDLENTLHELKVNSQEKDRILRTVAHDLRNPIGGIVALTNAMLDDGYSDEQKQLINLVNSTSANSLELINEILEATNTTNDKLSKESVEINGLVNSSVEILSFKAAEKNQKIVTELLDHPQKLMISRERIWRVISNLISNAIKFSPDGSAIDVKITSNPGTINISVSDNGIGIPDEIKDDVFNIFTNAKRPGTAGEKSFGLGLSICQQIIENHHGKIWFESEVNTGTTFHISLPAA
jgi:two-component system, OmpR family, sensor histidine kinase VicK